MVRPAAPAPLPVDGGPTEPVAFGAGPGPGVSTGSVARHLGVSPTTVRSWERRYGIGPAHRDPGQHRRWSAEDIALLDAMCRLTARGVPPAEAARAARAAAGAAEAAGAAAAGRGPGAADPGGSVPRAGRQVPGGSRAMRVGAVRPECRGLARAALRLDGPEVAGILRAALEALGPVRAWTEVMMPALRAAGRKWAVDGEQYVEVEHLLSWHVSAALRSAAIAPAAYREGPPALLAALPGEQHTLPLEAVAAAMAARGLPYRMLGAAVPPRALVDAVERLGPSAVLLWSQSRETADPRLAHRIGGTEWGPAGSRTSPLLITAGPGWSRPALLPGAARPASLEAALALLDRDAEVPGHRTASRD
ncbi:MerR family transcriptional regulator [Kitasatospora sp. NPDC088134]|uniref:MerR family transcriptional regulator n=1 Tax=Kitasatospora sp. NPDC088134 TaxID=3364071 RepID=UPI0037F8F2CD